jgi:hypothetical protein
MLVGDEYVRVNNISVAKPLKMSIALYTFLQRWYENRTFFDDTGNARREAWRVFVKLLWEYARESSGGNIFKVVRIYRGLANLVVGGVLLMRALKRRSGSWIANVRDGEKALSMFCDMNVRVNISNSLSVIDLDRIEAYNYFRDKGVFDKFYRSDLVSPSHVA